MTKLPLLSVLVAAPLWSPQAFAQSGRAAAGPKPKVDVVQTVGCVARRDGTPVTWWLTRAQEPTVTRDGVFNEVQIDAAKKASAQGSREFHLVGVADFLDAEGLLHSGDRAVFTQPDQVNATGELREGRRVLVKGLLIDGGTESRINLMAVVGLADTCP